MWLALAVFAYYRGITSSRVIASLCSSDLKFMALAGGILKIDNIEAAIKFILDWTSTEAQGPVGVESLALTIPKPIRSLDKYLGIHWGEPPFYLEYRNEHYCGQNLFACDHVIADPREQQSIDGVTTIFLANQGICEFGYNSSEELMLRGLWSGNEDHKDWVGFPATVEDVLIWALLNNFFWCMSTNEYGDARPDSNSVSLWSHPEWGGLEFWTDASQNILYYGSNGAVKRK
jgi:hypothetical protein